MTRTFEPGVYVPLVTFFAAGGAGIDADLTTLHTARLARAGVAGLVTAGSYGEGVLLTSQERIDLVATVRRALDNAGFPQLPVLAGVSDNSVQVAIANSQEAAKAGADAVLATPPSYFVGLTTDDSLVQYYTQLAAESPVPVVVYNFPGVTAGINLSSDVLVRLSKVPNVRGVKFTCGSVGKLARVAAATSKKDDPTFMNFAGMAEFLVPGLAVGGFGAIAGPANIAPKQIVAVYELWAAGKKDEAFEAQLALAELDYKLTGLGIEGTKVFLRKVYGAGQSAEQVRVPSSAFDEAKVKSILETGELYFQRE